MKYSAYSKMPDTPGGTSIAQTCGAVILSALFFAVCTPDVRAQVGNTNPTGPSGIFNGNLENTGVDPWTANGARSITDIFVAGAAGDYPLALVRTANSRTPSTSEVFSYAGGWNHNYNWIMEDSPSRNAANLAPLKYTVDFPDGRVETFRAVTWDSTFRVRPGDDTPAQPTSAGVRERLVPIAPPGNMYAYLLLPDGGKVKFQATQYNSNGQYFYKYTAVAIIDPHALETTLTWESYGNNGQKKRLKRVTEPAGRYLEFTYRDTNSAWISQVQEFINGVGRRSVQYQYPAGYLWLGSVVYYGNAAWTARYQYIGSIGDPNLPPLLWTADDPMYAAGPMKRISYEYKTGTNSDGTQAVYGQVWKVRYWNGTVGQENNGPVVSTLTVGFPNNNPVYRTETRGDGATRTFIYNGAGQGYLAWASDFMTHQSTQGYDDKKYINQVINFNRVTTDYTNDPITGNVLQIQFPFTPEDTNGQGNTRPTLNYTYTDNYYLHTFEDEGHNTTTITRDGNNRVTRIDYPDGGWETFSYDAGHFYQPQSHRMVTGGMENWTYDSRHRLDTYRNPDSPSPSPSPSAQYYYDTLDRVSSIHDALNHATDYQYNDRGQITLVTLPTDPVDSARHTIVYAYNPNGDGTLTSMTDQLNHVTSYTYDAYRRLRRVTPPMRGAGDNGVYTTNFYYDANGAADDYRFTDSNVTWIKLPSAPATKRIQAQYDDNRRRSSVTEAPGAPDEAITSFTYDSVGNVTWVSNPLGHNNVHTLYDARNRPYQITVGPGQTTNITYDTAGRRKEIDRPNGQVITYDTFDAMNRVTQQSATNTRVGFNQYIRSSYSYYPSGPANLLNTFQNPHLFGGSDQYTYSYDGMGRKTWLQYPLNSNNNHRTEHWSYDAVGRLDQFTNRDYPAKTQTFYYDALNRMTSFSWDDGGTTPGVSFSYDAASRLTGITNTNATISRTYFNDNLLKSETETATGGVARTVNYTYDADGNRASLGIPGYTFHYDYTKRNQLLNIINSANNGTIASYVYDMRGNMTTRTVNSNSTNSVYDYDVYDRVTSVNHNLASGTRTIQYGYDDTNHSNNRLWAKRVINAQSPENNKGEVFSYDLADQVSAFQLNVLNPNQVSQPLSQTMVYDPNGNRQFTPSGNYAAANNLSQYTTRTIAGNQTTATHDPKGNTTIGLDGSTYTYDAQNRLKQASKNGATMTFTYDGLNRQVSRRLGTGTTYYSVWDGWGLVEDYHKSVNNAVVDASYVYGSTGLIRDMESPNHYYYQDASGSTSHLANNSGNLVEWYRYDLDGNPIFYDSTDHVRSPNQSVYSVRHLFTGQQWYSDVGLYDLRNRFYSPDPGRFLEPDPIGLSGGNNLYRYCGNNPVTRRDSYGLTDAKQQATLPRIFVPGDPVPGNIRSTGFLPGDLGWPGIPWALEPFIEARLFGSREIAGTQLQLPESPSVQHPATSSVPPQNPQRTLANSPATTLLGKFLQSFNSQGGWNETANALDAFANFEVNLLLFGEGGTVLPRLLLGRGAIETPYALEMAGTSVKARVAIAAARNGATLYRAGELGKSMAGESQYWSLRNPLSPNYASKLGMPGVKMNFMMGGTLDPEASAIANEAASLGANVGGDAQIVTSPNGVTNLWFHMPDM